MNTKNPSLSRVMDRWSYGAQETFRAFTSSDLVLPADESANQKRNTQTSVSAAGAQPG